MRFETKIPPEAVIGYVHRLLHNEFSQVTPTPIVQMPPEVRNQEAFKNQPHYRLESKDFTVLLSPTLIAVSMLTEYPGWQVFRSKVVEIISKVSGELISEPVRYGLRYINFFEGDAMPNLTVDIRLPEIDTSGRTAFLKQSFSENSCEVLLQLGNNQRLAKAANLSVGTILDIDVFKVGGSLTTSLGRLQSFEEFLEAAHDTEKGLFFRLLKPDFLKTFKPVYSDQ